MAKDTTKKLKRGKFYKVVLITVGILFLVYFGYNTKLRFDEHTYRNHLEANGWEQVPDKVSEEENNFYELTENGVNYWIYVMPAGWVETPFPEYETRMVATYKNDFIIRVGADEEILINISPENDSAIHKQIYVQTNSDGELIENKEDWTEEYKNRIINYLATYQDIHKELIDQTLNKRQVVFEK